MLGAAFDPVLRAALSGAAWALERLWEDLGPLVTGYLQLNGAQDPDDLASEAFIAVFRSISSFEGDERALRSWVLVIAHRRLIDDRRRRARRPQEQEVDADALARVSGGHAEDDAMASLEDERVRAALATLSPDQRSVLTLRILGDLTIDQIATLLDKRPGAVKALQRRGLARLRATFSEEGVPL